jgi:hypothetical protein
MNNTMFLKKEAKHETKAQKITLTICNVILKIVGGMILLYGLLWALCGICKIVINILN